MQTLTSTSCCGSKRSREALGKFEDVGRALLEDPYRFEHDLSKIKRSYGLVCSEYFEGEIVQFVPIAPMAVSSKLVAGGSF